MNASEYEIENIQEVELLAEISSMCVAEITMGYKLDASRIGEMIYYVTGLNSEELSAEARRIKDIHRAECTD